MTHYFYNGREIWFGDVNPYLVPFVVGVVVVRYDEEEE